MSNDQEFQVIPIDSIIEPAEQPRTVISLEGLEALAASIKEQGVIQPIIVIKKDDKYEISSGERRYLAAKIAGLAAIPCLIRGLDLKQSDLQKLHENSFREDVNPVDEGKYFVRIHDKHGLAYNEIAKLCSRSESYIMNRVRLLECDSRVLAALEAGHLNFSQACEIARCADENIRFELLRIAVESGATTETLRGMRYDYEKRTNNGDPALVDAPVEPGNYPTEKHLIQCPCCNGAYPVNEIYPLSMCKTCYDGFLQGIKGEGGK